MVTIPIQQLMSDNAKVCTSSIFWRKIVCLLSFFIHIKGDVDDIEIENNLTFLHLSKNSRNSELMCESICENLLFIFQLCFFVCKSWRTYLYLSCTHVKTILLPWKCRELLKDAKFVNKNFSPCVENSQWFFTFWFSVFSDFFVLEMSYAIPRIANGDVWISTRQTLVCLPTRNITAKFENISDIGTISLGLFIIKLRRAPSHELENI